MLPFLWNFYVCTANFRVTGTLVIFYERMKVILVKSSTPSAYLPKMYCNGKKMSVCQIMVVLSQLICDMFTVSVPLIYWGDNLQSKILKKGGRDQKKMRVWGVLKSPCHRYLPGAAYYASCKKILYKIKYGF